MDLLLEVAREMKPFKDIHFVLIGEGAYKAKVERYIDQENIKNITMLPFQPYDDISHVFSVGNVGLVISKPGVARIQFRVKHGASCRQDDLFGKFRRE